MLVPFLLAAVAVGLVVSTIGIHIDIHTLGLLPDNPTQKKEYKKRQKMLKAPSRPQGKKTLESNQQPQPSTINKIYGCQHKLFPSFSKVIIYYLFYYKKVK